MKLKHLLQLVLTVLVGQFMFACNSAEYYRFTSAKPEAYEKALVKTETTNALKENTPTVAEAGLSTPSTESEDNVAGPLEASTGEAKPILFETKKAVKKAPVSIKTYPAVTEKKVAVEETNRKLSSMTKAEKKAFKKEVRTALRDANATSTVLKVILAILLPPLAVFLHEGIGTRFWISVLLTLLLYLPGIIYALLVVTDSI